VDTRKRATLIWLDLETTGLNPLKHQILEVAAIATDDDLNELGSYHAVTSVAGFASAHDAETEALHMHLESGLWVESMRSTKDLPIVDTELARFIHQHVNADLNDDQVRKLDYQDQRKRRPNLAGNSVWFDRAFMDKYLRQSAGALQHRLLDITAMHEFARRCWPEAHCRAEKPAKHRATADILNSLLAARAYRRSVKELHAPASPIIVPTPIESVTLSGVVESPKAEVAATPDIPDAVMAGLRALVTLPASSLSKPLRTPEVAGALDWIRAAIGHAPAPSANTVDGEAKS
jgi:oligoribonuclease